MDNKTFNDVFINPEHVVRVYTRALWDFIKQMLQIHIHRQLSPVILVSVLTCEVKQT